MIFDTHTDVLFDIINNNHSFSYHLHEMSGYYGAVLNYYFKGNESYDSFLFVLGEIKKFYKSNFNVIKKRNFILGIEGLGPLRSLSDIKLLKDAGIKIIIEEIDDVNDNNNVYEDIDNLKQDDRNDFNSIMVNKLISEIDQLSPQESNKEDQNNDAKNEVSVTEDSFINNKASELISVIEQSIINDK